MKRVFCILIAACLLLGLTACGDDKQSQQPGQSKPQNNTNQTPTDKFSAYSFDYFDTATTITGYAESQKAFDEVANKALDRLGEYHRLYDIYKRYEGLENLCTINDVVDGAHRTVTVDQKIIDMLLYAREMHDKTDGMVNVAMGSVLKIWHDYRTVGMSDPADAVLPPMDKLQEAAQHTDITKMVIDDDANTVTLTDPQMRLDVGAIAKGYATEQVARWLEGQGISGWLLNVGGNVRAVGKKPEGTPWVAGLENPQDTSADYVNLLMLTTEALVTSGSYQRFYVVNGQSYHHIIHPDTLMPAEGYLQVSVICSDSGMGDALSTALFCMTIEEGKRLISSMNGVAASWVTADGKQTVSDGWNKYVKK